MGIGRSTNSTSNGTAAIHATAPLTKRLLLVPAERRREWSSSYSWYTNGAGQWFHRAKGATISLDTGNAH